MAEPVQKRLIVTDWGSVQGARTWAPFAAPTLGWEPAHGDNAEAQAQPEDRRTKKGSLTARSARWQHGRLQGCWKPTGPVGHHWAARKAVVAGRKGSPGEAIVRPVGTEVLDATPLARSSHPTGQDRQRQGKPEGWDLGTFLLGNMHISPLRITDTRRTRPSAAPARLGRAGVHRPNLLGKQMSATLLSSGQGSFAHPRSFLFPSIPPAIP